MARPSYWYVRLVASSKKIMPQAQRPPLVRPWYPKFAFSRPVSKISTALCVSVDQVFETLWFDKNTTVYRTYLTEVPTSLAKEASLKRNKAVLSTALSRGRTFRLHLSRRRRVRQSLMKPVRFTNKLRDLNDKGLRALSAPVHFVVSVGDVS